MDKSLKLDWSPPTPPDDTCVFHHVAVDTQFGRIVMTWNPNGEPGYFTILQPDWLRVPLIAMDLEAAQEWVEEQLKDKAMETLGDLGYNTGGVVPGHG